MIRFLAAFLLLGSTAFGGVQTFTVTLPPSDVIPLNGRPSTSINVPVVLAQLPPTTGTLDRVAIYTFVPYPMTTGSLARVENLSATPVPGDATYQMAVLFFWSYAPSNARIPEQYVHGSGMQRAFSNPLQSPWLPPGAGLAAFDGTFNFAGPSANPSLFIGFEEDAFVNVNVTEPAELAHFAGTGNVTIYWHPSGIEFTRLVPAGSAPVIQRRLRIAPTSCNVAYFYH